MAEPELLVHRPQKLQEACPAMAGHPEIDDAGEGNGAQILLPDEVKPIVAPAPGQLDQHLLGRVAVEAPLVGVDQFFQNVQGIAADFGCSTVRPAITRPPWTKTAAELAKDPLANPKGRMMKRSYPPDLACQIPNPVQ